MARRAVKFVLSDALVTESIYIGAAVFCVYAEELWGFTLLPKSNKRFHGITGRRREREGDWRVQVESVWFKV